MLSADPIAGAGTLTGFRPGPVALLLATAMTPAAELPCVAGTAVFTSMTGVCVVLSRRNMAGDLQIGVGLGFRPWFGLEPGPVPEASLDQQPLQPVNAVADYADLPLRLLPTVAMLSRQRLGRLPQVAWVYPAVLGVFHPGAISQGQRRRHQQH